MKRWVSLQLHIFKIQVHVEDRNQGVYNNPPYLFVHLNQASLIEVLPYVVAMPVPFRMFMNIGYVLLPFVGWLLWLLGGVAIFRQWRWQALRGLKKTARRMRRGMNFGISIEGQRSRDGQLQRYKKGALILAREAGATLVPLVMRGARERLPFGEWRVRPGSVEAVFDQVITPVEIASLDNETLLHRLKTIAERETHF
ncbi:MAG: 1-acyl-sn-glycerol-3-phosphate acyltransferase [Deltaproteobacteria bacterium]|nr:1-acyl-sn-glycerol-3-phosphate acyltransferase [Deltaproteobacteria bacterium]